MIGNIKSLWLRRLVIVVAAVPIILIAAAVGAADYAKSNTRDLMDAWARGI